MYGRPQHSYRGTSANKLHIRQSQLEKKLFSGLQEAVLERKALDYDASHMRIWRFRDCRMLPTFSGRSWALRAAENKPRPIALASE